MITETITACRKTVWRCCLQIIHINTNLATGTIALVQPMDSIIKSWSYARIVLGPDAPRFPKLIRLPQRPPWLPLWLLLRFPLRFLLRLPQFLPTKLALCLPFRFPSRLPTTSYIRFLSLLEEFKL